VCHYHTERDAHTSRESVVYHYYTEREKHTKREGQCVIATQKENICFLTGIMESNTFWFSLVGGYHHFRGP
jgi:hypothetical protein